jgi:poly(3-hydroxybutyrate) depolymerase
MSVWPQGGVPDRPLLIAAHGNGGAGPKEIKGWLRIAKEHRFTIVCPSFLSSVRAGSLPEDEPYFEACLRWIKDNLQYSSDNVFMAGFSGGGFPTWYLATKRPDFFHGIVLQSGNFAGGYYDLNLSHWFHKPIKLIWGSQDLADIPIQNGQAVEMLKSEDCKDFTTEIVPGGHHQEHQDLVVNWMEQNLAAPASN